MATDNPSEDGCWETVETPARVSGKPTIREVKVMTIKSDQTPFCECCGKETRIGWRIHFLCMGKHWSKHVKGINASRCEEMKIQRAMEVKYGSKKLWQ